MCKYTHEVSDENLEINVLENYDRWDHRCTRNEHF